MKHTRRACLGLALATSALLVQAQDYPTRPVRMIIPAAPGGAVDVIGRVLAGKLSTSLGKQVLPDNRAGAGTMMASQELATSPPDGQTILVVTSSHAINAAVRKNIRYNSASDFAAVSLVASVPDLLVVNAESPVRTVADLVRAAKAQPGKINFGSAGPGSYSHLDAELFKGIAGVDIVHVPYKGGVPAITALLGKEIDMMFLSVPGLAPHVKSGRLRALAVTGKERSPLFPDVPTMAEAGVREFYAVSWYGVLVPAKTPPAIISKLNAQINEALKQPDVRDKLSAVGVDLLGTTPEFFTTYLKEDIARWQRVVDKAPQLKLDD